MIYVNICWFEIKFPRYKYSNFYVFIIAISPYIAIRDLHESYFWFDIHRSIEPLIDVYYEHMSF